MDARPEREMAGRVRSGQPELVRVVEHPLVPVGRLEGEHHPVAGPDRAAADIEVAHSEPEHGSDRRTVAQSLVPRGLDARPAAGQRTHRSRRSSSYSRSSNVYAVVGNPAAISWYTWVGSLVPRRRAGRSRPVDQARDHVVRAAAPSRSATSPDR